MKQYSKPEMNLTVLESISALNSSDIEIDTKNDGDDGDLF